MTAMEAQQELAHIVLRTSTGDLTHAEGKALAQPYLDIINKRGAEIAKKHKRSYRKLDFGYALRLGI